MRRPLRADDARAAEQPADAPAPKRRRLNSSPGTVLRPVAELRDSLELLYSRLQGEPDSMANASPAADPAFLKSEMVIVRTLGAKNQRSFRCLRSLLASASRPLAAMLYGSDGLRMCEADAVSIDLHDVEPSTFELLLLYMHGKTLQLTVPSAMALYSLADYYDITSLRESCCEFLEAGVRPDAICWWLSQAREIRCERLLNRCLETLHTELVAADATDPDFRSISEDDFAGALKSSTVVCTGERDVWEILQRWAHGRSDEPAILARLAQHIRWPLMDSAYLKSLVSARCSRSHAFLPKCVTAALKYQALSPEERAADAELAAMGELATPRQYLLLLGVLLGRHACQLGELVIVNRAGAPAEEPREIKPGDEYTVGRSRRSDLVFANPFVSATHCRIFIEEVGEGPSRELEVKLKDVSSNGAYVNSELVGRDNVVSLKHGDRISVVRPQGANGEGGGGGNAVMGYILYRQHRASARGAESGSSKGERSAGETEAGGELNAEEQALTPEE